MFGGQQNPFLQGMGSPYGPPQQKPQFGQGYGTYGLGGSFGQLSGTGGLGGYGQGGYGMGGYGQGFPGMGQGQPQYAAPYGQQGLQPPRSPQASGSVFGDFSFSSPTATSNPFTPSGSTSLGGTVSRDAITDPPVAKPTDTPLTNPGDGGGTAVRRSSPVFDPNAAVQRALADWGIDPAYNFNPYVQQTLQRARELVYSTLGRLVQQGQGGQIADDTLMQSRVHEAVQQALGGQAVFGTNGNGTDVLRQVQAFAGQSAPGNPGAQVLANLLSDPDTATAMASSLLYGGTSSNLARLYTAPIASQAAQYQRNLETGSNGAGTYGNLLQYLLAQAPQTFYNSFARG